MENISLIKDAADPILTHQEHQTSSSGVTYFERPFILNEPIERPDMRMDIDMEVKKLSLLLTQAVRGPQAYPH